MPAASGRISSPPACVIPTPARPTAGPFAVSSNGWSRSIPASPCTRSPPAQVGSVFRSTPRQPAEAQAAPGGAAPPLRSFCHPSPDGTQPGRLCSWRTLPGRRGQDARNHRRTGPQADCLHPDYPEGEGDNDPRPAAVEITVPLLVGLRDKAALGVMLFTAARAGAIAKLRLKHLRPRRQPVDAAFRGKGRQVAGNPGSP